MHEPPDFTMTPTPSDAVCAKEVIEEMERSLIEDPTRDQELARDLEALKAWIAPVRRLNLDVLCLIFEFCGEDSWKTPLRISGVSRQWRNMVHATTRAWAFLPLHKCKQDEDLINHFFKHSGQWPLHIFLNDSHLLTTLSEVIGRLKCLSVHGPSHIRGIPVFPKLERLSIRSDTRRVRLSDLCVSRFPALRELICASLLGRGVPSSMKVAFPPLQVLSIAVWDSALPELLIGCRSSLVSLRLEVADGDPEFKQEVLLPVLKCLYLYIWGYCSGSMLNCLKTPAIETYIEGRQDTAPFAGSTPIYGDVGSVTQTRVYHAPNLSRMPLLRELQLPVGLDVGIVLSQLLSNRSLCPSLEVIEAGLPVTPYETTLVDLNRERPQPVSIKKVDTWSKTLPYEILPSPVSV